MTQAEQVFRCRDRCRRVVEDRVRHSAALAAGRCDDGNPRRQLPDSGDPSRVELQHDDTRNGIGEGHVDRFLHHGRFVGFDDRDHDDEAGRAWLLPQYLGWSARYPQRVVAPGQHRDRRLVTPDQSTGSAVRTVVQFIDCGRERVSRRTALTGTEPVSTRDTVGTDTSASLATSAIAGARVSDLDISLEG